jgi:UDP-3-O-[3-hydroxymyristoyl] glucosamine N-acyltransferase
MKLKDIAELVNGAIIGDEGIEITGVAGIGDAKDGDITYLSRTGLLAQARQCGASAVLVREQAEDLVKQQIIVKNPQYAFALLLAHFHEKPPIFKGISEKAVVSSSASVGSGTAIYPFAFVADGAVIGENCVIYPGVFIGDNSRVGSECILYPGVTVREGVVIGNRVLIHPGAVIGADGFGYVFEEGAHRKIPQVGGVIIGDDVEIGANVTIDRATVGNTVIGEGSKIDNLVHIAHNVVIGSHVIIIAGAGVAGSCEIGDGAVIGGQVALSDHVKVEAGTMIVGQSGVISDVKKGIYSGSPILPHRNWLKSSALFAKLPELNRRLRELEEKMDRLQNKERS